MKAKATRLNRSLWGNGIAIFFLLFLGAFMLLPLVYTTTSAFKPPEEFYVFPPRLYAVNPTGTNFLDLWDIMANLRVPLSRYVYNTMFTALLGTVRLCAVQAPVSGAQGDRPHHRGGAFV